MTTWRLHLSNFGVNAICDLPELRFGFGIATFAADPHAMAAAAVAYPSRCACQAM